MRIFRLFVMLLSLAGLALAQEPAQPAGATEKPKLVPGFDPNAIDKSVDPCTDFYQYACGNWLKANEIPADQAVWGRFTELLERNNAALREILEKRMAATPGRDVLDAKIGDYYAACMDETGIEAKGTEAVRPEFDRINRIKDKKNLVEAFTRLQSIGVRAPFGYGSIPDAKNSTQVIANLDQAGLSLPDRDYYTKTDAKSEEIRKQYVEHVQKMFTLAGEKPEDAARDAQTVMKLETELAKASMDRVSRRDPYKRFNKKTRDELSALAPSVQWAKFFSDTGTGTVKDLNVVAPDFFKGLESELKTASLDDWKTYLRWHVLRTSAPLMPKAFVDENFRFFGTVLTGQTENRPRWKRCVNLTDRDLGEALGQRFVEQVFGPESKSRTLKMVQALEKALQSDIKALPWMTETTKTQALAKLQAIANKIGYPDNWRDYSSVEVRRNDALGNSFRGRYFDYRRELNKIGKPLDRKEWLMTPPTVNAYYSSQMNDINFPAGILQPPFYDNNLDDAVNFGGIGAVIGHELTHGFDDSGSQFDPQGNLRNWWTDEDKKAFEQRTGCLVDEYTAFEVKDPNDPKNDVHLNGKLTLGENTADNGGLRIAYMALMDTLAGKEQAAIDGYTPDQRLFLGWGQIWCQKQRPQAARMRALTDPHSPGQYRVNGVVSNMPEFQKAFSCKESTAMVRPNACRVW